MFISKYAKTKFINSLSKYKKLLFRYIYIVIFYNIIKSINKKNINIFFLFSWSYLYTNLKSLKDLSEADAEAQA